MTSHTTYGGFDKLNHRKFYFLDIPFAIANGFLYPAILSPNVYFLLSIS